MCGTYNDGAFQDMIEFLREASDYHIEKIKITYYEVLVEQQKV